MLEGLEYVKETIEFRANDILENAFETNNLLMDDLILALGYNKRREKGVREVYSGPINWEIAVSDEKRFTILVCGYKSGITECEELNEAINSSINNGFDFIVITDGESLAIHDESGEISRLDNILSDESDDILRLISNEGWDPDSIRSLKKSKTIEPGELTSLLLSYTICEVILQNMQMDVNDENIQILITALNTLINSTSISTETNKAEDGSAIQELTAENNRLSKEVSELSEKLTANIEYIESAKQHLSERDAKIEELNNQLSSANNTAESTKQQLDEKDKKIESLANTIEALNEQMSSINSNDESAKQQLDEKDKKIEELSNQLSSANSAAETVRQQLSERDAKIEELNRQLYSANSVVEHSDEESKKKDEVIAGYESKIAELNVEIDNLRNTNNELVSAKDQSGTASEEFDLQLANKSRELEDAIEINKKLEEKVEELEAKVKHMEEANKQSEGFTESAYRNRIAELIASNQELTVELKEAKDKLDDIARKQAGEEDKRIVMARQLLEAVEDNPELMRTYVGVVESKLFQINELSKFVGTCLQELYSVVSFDLMHILFDGDVFKVVQPAVRGDLMINTKQYDIDISDLTEKEVLTRLKTLFSKFEKVVFMCKTIGTYREGYNNNKDYSELENLVFTSGVNIGEDEADIFDERMGIDTKTNKEQKAKEEELDTSPVLGLVLCDVGPVLWEEKSPITNLAGIGDINGTFKIDKSSFESVIETGVVSLICLTDNQSVALDNLQQIDLAEHSAWIKREGQSGSGIAIPFTQYFAEVDTIQKCISTLINIAEAIGLNATQVYMYFDAEYDEGGGLVENFIDRQSLQLQYRVDVDNLNRCPDNIHCMLSGSGYYAIEHIPGMSDIIKGMIQDVIAVRTSYMKSSLRSINDVAHTIGTMLSIVDSDTAINCIEQLNSTVEYSANVILSGTDNHSDQAVDINVGGNIYYIEKLPGYILANMLFQLNKMVSTDNAIDLRVELNSTLYAHHRDGAVTADCNEYLAGRMFVAITEGKTKIIIK